MAVVVVSSVFAVVLTSAVGTSSLCDVNTFALRYGFFQGFFSVVVVKLCSVLKFSLAAVVVVSVVVGVMSSLGVSEVLEVYGSVEVAVVESEELCDVTSITSILVTRVGKEFFALGVVTIDEAVVDVVRCSIFVSSSTVRIGGGSVLASVAVLLVAVLDLAVISGATSSINVVTKRVDVWTGFSVVEVSETVVVLGSEVTVTVPMVLLGAVDSKGAAEVSGSEVTIAAIVLLGAVDSEGTAEVIDSEGRVTVCVVLLAAVDSEGGAEVLESVNVSEFVVSLLSAVDEPSVADRVTAEVVSGP
ncbi:unnamed protein product [Cylicostephanus goldi]|uniref:Uncharacterized protein n=1 Tax=Cylicostephanus goldi TaxID=71465 RepID=A0A3P6T3U1_CYLGO|nr:unnamed protein product [Cylicostephanus goldi]